MTLDSKKLLDGVGWKLLRELQTDARLSFAELGRRRVLQTALIYAAAAWSIIEVLSFLIEALPVFPEGSKSFVAILFVVGFPVTMFLAWRFDIGPGGLRRTDAASAEGRLTIAAATVPSHPGSRRDRTAGTDSRARPYGHPLIGQSGDHRSRS